MPSEPEICELDVLIGTWRTEGEVFGDDGEIPVARVDGYDHYEWLGRAFVIHRIDVEMGGEPVQGLEMIGPYLGGRSFATRAYDHEEASRPRRRRWTATVCGPFGRTVPRRRCRSQRTARSRWSNGSAATAARPGGRGCASRSRAGSRAEPFHRAVRLATLDAGSPALVAQWREQRFPKPCVAGSIPAGGTRSWPMSPRRSAGGPTRCLGVRSVIGVPYNSAGRSDGVAEAPAALRAAGLVEGLVDAGAAVVDRGDTDRPHLAGETPSPA